jgi:hypothetical protein
LCVSNSLNSRRGEDIRIKKTKKKILTSCRKEKRKKEEQIDTQEESTDERLETDRSLDGIWKKDVPSSSLFTSIRRRDEAIPINRPKSRLSPPFPASDTIPLGVRVFSFF